MEARRKIGGVIIVLLGFIFLGFQGECLGNDDAIDQLINMFEKKGLLNATEVDQVRQTLHHEQEEVLKKQREIQDKERVLLIKEEELKKKEEALQQKISRPSAEKVSTPESPSSEGKGAKISFENGLRLSTHEPYEFSLRLGTLLQADYRHFNYGEEDTGKDRFDIRRARLVVEGTTLKYFDYKFQYEFQGAQSRNLLDAYVDANVLRAASFRVGQFKEPFGLEQSNDVKNWIFAEPAVVYFLSPSRDVGVAAHASLCDDRVNYGIGIFNGDGPDDTVGGDEDSPQITGRLVVSPFRSMNIPVLENLQFGGSLSHANIDRNNVSIELKTPGLTPFFSVEASAKYRLIRDANSLNRYDAELGWAYGPLALMGEYAKVHYDDVQTSAEQFDIDLDAWYVSFLWMITGEKPSFRHGVFQPIDPARSVFQGGLGALGLALRYQAFRTDEDMYQYLVTEGESVRRADSYSLALNWWLNRFVRVIVDFTRTEFDSPLLIARDSLEGTSIYSDHEDVVTGRWQFQF